MQTEIIQIEKTEIIFNVSLTDDYLSSIFENYDYDRENSYKIIYNSAENTLISFSTSSYYSDDNYYHDSISELQTHFGNQISDFVASTLTQNNFPTENFTVIDD